MRWRKFHGASTYPRNPLGMRVKGFMQPSWKIIVNSLRLILIFWGATSGGGQLNSYEYIFRQGTKSMSSSASAKRRRWSTFKQLAKVKRVRPTISCSRGTENQSRWTSTPSRTSTFPRSSSCDNDKMIFTNSSDYRSRFLFSTDRDCKQLQKFRIASQITDTPYNKHAQTWTNANKHKHQ